MIIHSSQSSFIFSRSVYESENMKTKLAIAVALIVVVIAVVTFGTLNAMAKGTPFYARSGHGCSDAKLIFSKTYINQPNEGSQFHTQEFMSEYNTGFNTCSHGPSPIVVSSVGDGSSSNSSSSLSFKQGYAKGVSDAKSQQSRFPVSTIMRPDDVDCDSDIDPHMSNEEYCAGYQHGFADTMNNNKLLEK